MKMNAGTADRVMLVGLLPLATGLAGWCALYKPFGIDTSHQAPHAQR